MRTEKIVVENFKAPSGRVVNVTESRVTDLDGWTCGYSYYATVETLSGYNQEYLGGRGYGDKAQTVEVAINGDVEQYLKYLEHQKFMRRRADDERRGRSVIRGNAAYVYRSSRKHLGKSGIVKWVGENRYGESCLIDPMNGEESFFVPTHYVECYPTPEEWL